MKFVEKNGRVWPSKKAYKHYKNNIKQYMNFYYEFENYSDDTDDFSIDNDEGFKTLYNLWKMEDKMTAQELIEKSDFVIDRFNKIVDKVGREKFYTFDDGSIEYIWKFKFKEKNK